jgi:phenylalanyl-tRNA synthetase beta chain
VPVRPAISSFPPVHMDVALVVPADRPEADVRTALAEGAGELLEDLRLFDVYTGTPVPEGHRSLAYALTFRAPDRTLTGEEAAAAFTAAVEAAGRATGAVLRG